MAKTAQKVTYTKVGRNVRARVANGNLIIKMNLAEEGEESASGKSMIVAINKGNFTKLDELLTDDADELENLSLKVMLIKTKKKKAAKKPEVDADEDDEDED